MVVVIRFVDCYVYCIILNRHGSGVDKMLCFQFVNQKIFGHRFFKKLRIKFGRDGTVLTSPEPSPCVLFLGTERSVISLHVFRITVQDEDEWLHV
jgi:hypothetical protein